MFIGYRAVIIGPEQCKEGLRGKEYIDIGFIFQQLKFICYKETLKAISYNNSSFKTLFLSYINILKGSKLPKRLSKLLP
jgi:hypothetical protein